MSSLIYKLKVHLIYQIRKLTKLPFLPLEKIPFSICLRWNQSSGESLCLSFSQRYKMETLLIPYFTDNKSNMQDLMSMGRLAPSTSRRTVTILYQGNPSVFYSWAGHWLTDVVLIYTLKKLNHSSSTAGHSSKRWNQFSESTTSTINAKCIFHCRTRKSESPWMRLYKTIQFEQFSTYFQMDPRGLILVLI